MWSRKGKGVYFKGELKMKLEDVLDKPIKNINKSKRVRKLKKRGD